MIQAVAIQQVQKKITDALERNVCQDPAEAAALLKEIYEDLQYFHQEGIDYKIVVDALDDSIYITDAVGRVLYVNPAHRRNTGIEPEEVLGRLTDEIEAQGNLFTGGATTSVIKEKKKVFRLATVTKLDPPQIGYAVGVPIFNENGDLHQVVVSSRPLISLRALQQDYDRFIKEVQAIDRERKQVQILKNSDISERLVGSSHSLLGVWKTIEMAAPTDATVLITGESGVGKEIVADEIYRLSRRNDKIFVKVNCSAIPANLLESELFGYEKGAFSGANTTGKTGLFETANGGTLLLDEIGEMPMDLQVKLLRAIQDKKITRVGGTRPIDLDIRFIASTNSDLKQKIADGLFRQDLFYRLNVIPISIPPLRERIGDLEELCSHFIKVFNEKHERSLILSAQNMALLRSYNWPGNVRELENVIEYLTICSNGNAVEDEMIRGILDLDQGDVLPAATGTLAESLENYEKNLIESVLRESKSLRDAGARLGVNASTISRKIKQYGIDYAGSK